MRYQSVSSSNRVFTDIRTKNVTLTGGAQEILTEDFLNPKSELVHLVEFITSAQCCVTFTFNRGEVSSPKVLNPGRVISFQDLSPIRSIIAEGVEGTVLEVAIAI